MHAILFGEVSAFSDKIYCWFLRGNCENDSTHLKYNKIPFFKFMEIIEFLV